MVGKTLGHYEILEPLGKGGMGEVYRARDTKLNRDVAIKVLPEDFATDPERLARLQREAQLLAALNHPNIAAIYGLEDAGEISFLAMELAEGQTLAKRLSDGAIGVDEALKIALQIAEALEAAHERGIVHRDLKPANIQVATEGSAAGQVKVLDFGLAKAFESDGTSQEMSPDLSHSPTMAAATRTGVIMGTAAYMSPEQARGKPVDKRTDIWAFGCVVFEMLTGKRAFQGETVTDILAAIVHQEPQWEALPPDTPFRIRDLLKRCLKKQADERLRDVGECRIAVKEYLADPEGEKRRALASAGTTTARGISWKFTAPIAVATLLIGVLGTWLATRPALPVPEPLVRFGIELPPDTNFLRWNNRIIAVSPDGLWIAFNLSDGLWLRRIDDLEPSLVRGTEGARTPFFSPDSQQLGFWAEGQIKRVAVTGGAVVSLGPSEAATFGASWEEDGNIYFGQGTEGIFRVSETGGEPEIVVPMQDGELAHGPQLLPGGEWVLFTLSSGGQWNDASIVAHSLTTDERKELVPGGTEGRYVPSGHIVYLHDGTLFAVPFDVNSVAAEPGPVSIVEDVWKPNNATGAAHYGVSASGSLVYVLGIGEVEFELTFVDRDGREEPLPIDRDVYSHPRLSPDGTKLAVERPGQNGQDIWLRDLLLGSWTQFTFSGGDFWPLWTQDGSRIVFGSTREPAGLFSKNADGTGQVEPLVSGAGLRPHTWSEDGSVLVVQSSAGPATVSMTGEARVEPLLEDEEFVIDYPRVSPDGRWIAYVANTQGDRVFVRPFPNVADGRWQVSPGVGDDPIWSIDGSELFYMGGDGTGYGEVFGVPVEAGPPFGVPRVILEGPYWEGGGVQYDVMEDGRFLVMKSPQSETVGLPIRVVLNWFEELKQRVPTGGSQ